MSKEDNIEVTGVVLEKFPSGLFSVQLEHDRVVLAHLAGRLRRNLTYHRLKSVLSVSNPSPGWQGAEPAPCFRLPLVPPEIPGDGNANWSGRTACDSLAYRPP